MTYTEAVIKGVCLECGKPAHGSRKDDWNGWGSPYCLKHKREIAKRQQEHRQKPEA